MNISIDRGDVGIRLDRVLLRHLAHVPGMSRSRIRRLIEAGSVSINGARAPRVAWRVAHGDEIRVEVPERTPRSRPAPEALALDVRFEDTHLLIVNKPAGQVTHPAFRHTSGTLLNALLAHASGGWTPALLTRLDKDTSGLVLVAKHSTVQAVLHRAAGRNEIVKEYLALVAGRPTPARGTINLALDRDPWDRRRVMVRDRGGQPSVTRYQRVRTSPDGSTSLVRCRLVTGRMHQIRVHLKARGWPLLGDPVYGVRDPRIGRPALHAWRLTFTHPVTGEPLALEAPIPADLKALVDAF